MAGHGRQAPRDSGDNEHPPAPSASSSSQAYRNRNTIDLTTNNYRTQFQPTAANRFPASRNNTTAPVPMPMPVPISRPSAPSYTTTRAAPATSYGSFGNKYEGSFASGFKPAVNKAAVNANYMPHLQAPGAYKNPKNMIDLTKETIDVTSNNYRYQPQPATGYGFVDPKKASEDLKALLEGAIEDDDDKPRTRSRKKKKDAAIEGGLSSMFNSLKVTGPEPEAVVEESEDEDDGTVEGIKVKLLPHQVEGLSWMTARELGNGKKGTVPKGGILADDMGLGKTLQSVSLIITNPKPQGSDLADGKRKFPAGMSKCTLVVAPLALIRQWEAEIKDKVEESHALRVVVHHGPQRTKNFNDLKKYDVVITTYQILVSEWGDSSDEADGVKVGCFGVHWYRVILDEAHTIKNRNAKATKACYSLRSEYRWCLTGTPMQNNLDELQSLIKFLRIKPYDDLAQWKDQIDRPMKNGRGDVAILRLQQYLKIFMKRRTKEILKKEGALNPGGKPSKAGEASTTGFKVTERKIEKVFAEFSAEERLFYDKLEQRTDRSLKNMMDGSNVNYASALVLLLRLRQACNHPKLCTSSLDKDNEALGAELSTVPATPSKKSAVDDDLDDLADMFGGMDVASKKCEMCQLPIGKTLAQVGAVRCEDCEADLLRSTRKPKKSRKLISRKEHMKQIRDESPSPREEPPSPTIEAPSPTTTAMSSMSTYSFPTSRLKIRQESADRTPLILVACGSFSPITYLHLRMFEMAADFVKFNTQFELMGGYMSPVSDAYKKAGLEAAHHRLSMCEIAVQQTSNWLMVDPWEALQETYTRTANVLDHIEQEINGKLGGVEDVNGKKRPVRIALLAGADLIETMSTPGVWSHSDLAHILGRYGTFIVERSGTDIDSAISYLEPWKENIWVIQQLIQNDVSSTKIRLFLRREMSVRYLIPRPVIDYIEENGLYIEEGKQKEKMAEKSAELEKEKQKEKEKEVVIRSSQRSQSESNTKPKSRSKDVITISSDSEQSDGESAVEVETDSDSDDATAGMPHSHKLSQIITSTKIKHLLSILDKEVDEHKFIVFSQFTSMLDLIEPFLKRDGYKYTRYDGKMRNDHREAALKMLREEKSCRILLCSLKCGSLGLNLTAATRVVILEPFWNPFVEEQAIDRVHRLTQKVDVVVYKITIKDSVEERILELQEKKRELARQAIEGGKDGGVGKLGMREIMQLFRREAEDAPPIMEGGVTSYTRGDLRGDVVGGTKALRGRRSEEDYHVDDKYASSRWAKGEYKPESERASRESTVSATSSGGEAAPRRGKKWKVRGVVEDPVYGRR